MKKKRFAALLAVCMLLSACGRPGAEGDQTRPGPAPEYSFETTEAQSSFAAEDGTLLASYSYQRPIMSVSNLEELSEADRETAQRNMDQFNERMLAQLDDAVAEGKAMGETALAAYDQMGELISAYYSESGVTWWMGGNIVSLRVDGVSYTGGAHPNSGTGSFTFDLSTGQFIDPIQISDDPLGFQQGVSELLIEKAEALGEEYTGLYWNDYKATLCRWNQSAAVFGDDGLTVVYGPYELGPYAMGTVELSMSYEEIGHMLGAGGKTALGLDG